MTDNEFELLCDNAPMVAVSCAIDSAQKQRYTNAWCCLTLLANLHLAIQWAISYPTIERLALAQDGLIDPDAGPTAKIELLYDLLPKALFMPDGILDWRIAALFHRHGFQLGKYLSASDDGAYHLRTLRGHFTIWPPEGATC